MSQAPPDKAKVAYGVIIQQGYVGSLRLFVFLTICPGFRALFLAAAAAAYTHSTSIPESLSCFLPSCCRAATPALHTLRLCSLLGFTWALKVEPFCLSHLNWSLMCRSACVLGSRNTEPQRKGHIRKTRLHGTMQEEEQGPSPTPGQTQAQPSSSGLTPIEEELKREEEAKKQKAEEKKARAKVWVH